ncbi:MAG TPA: bifunctional glycosyltransferase/class I SAM-dependent methyltransferase, partial [Candidatus Omnitrophota bacterium]|nr:bifunctional glycosyltransferase/class I SAM-dependent methyltransferase [Candidatus Omnitrophota bacterium]
IKYGYDVVILLHGDAQYAPEFMSNLIEPLVKNEADAVFGSRMLKKGAALKGGMPLYKYIGNKILTFVQNALMGVKLSEWHSGYRAYRIDGLKKICFERNSNGFAFDTDIILQLIQCRSRIKEVSIPTFYGNEICYVNGIRYALEIIYSTLICRLHNMNLYYERKYDCCPSFENYPLKLGYSSSHSYALSVIKENSRVLDIGCGEGLIARELKKKGCHVVGVDHKKPQDMSSFEAFFEARLPIQEKPWSSNYNFDYCLLLDILEHVVDPEYFLDRLRDWLQGHNCTVIITSANIAFFIPRLQLLLGRFNYVKRGILDMTHVRLFTCGTLSKILQQCGYKVLKVKGIPAPFPEVIKIRPIALFFVGLNRFLIKIFKNMFSYQVYIECKPYANLDFLLSKSLEHTKKLRESAK